MIRNTRDSWGAAAKFFHWITAVLVLVQIALGWIAVSWPFSPAKAHLYVWHKSLGLLLLAVIVLRLLWRIANPTPALPAEMPAWESRCARGSYILLYAVLIAMPLSGWVLNSAANVPFRIFWLLPVPAVVGPSESIARAAGLVHLTLFLLLTMLLLVHIGAALRHHFVTRDDVLRRMLPKLGPRALRSFLLLVALLALVMPGTPKAANWSMDRTASRLEFIVTFESASAPGVFREFETHVHLDPEKPQEGRVDVKIAIGSADMASAGINRAIRAREWFDSARFPLAEFHSMEVRRVKTDGYIARGTLTLKGVRREVEVPFVWSEAAEVAAMRGELTVRRADFGIGTGEWSGSDVVGADVKVRFIVQLRRGG